MKKRKKKIDLFYILFKCILAIIILGFLTYYIVKFIIKIVDFYVQIKDKINDFNSFLPLMFSFILVIAIGSLINYVINNWQRRDDFFLFIVRILNSPSNYIYEKRKKELINYRNEVKKLTDYILYFSTIPSKKISNEDFLLFVEKVKLQNELLEKNRRKLEKEDTKINIFIQVFVLLCGIITALLF